MSVVIGSGQYRYRVEQDWAKLPEGWLFGEVAAVGVDSQDRVYAFCRGAHPMIVFDRDGRFLGSWGEGVFKNPHGLHVGPDDTLYCTDDGDHTVRRCTLDGRVLLEIGVPGRPAPAMSGQPFNRCTHTALSPEGDIYVSDGYANACVHKYSPEGRLLMSWGSPGTDPGQFNLPHNVCCDAQGWVYVADRESHRVQVFDGQGRFQTQWNNLHRPCSLCMARDQAVFYCGEIGPALGINIDTPNLGARISVLDREGRPLARLGGDRPGVTPGRFISPHGLAIDSHEDLYVAEVSRNAWPRYNGGAAAPPGVRTLHKLVRLRD